MRKNVRLNWLEGSSEVSLQICKLREVHGNFRGLSRNQGKILSDQHLVSPHKHSLVVTMESPENVIKILIKFWLLLISNSFNKITLQWKSHQLLAGVQRKNSIPCNGNILVPKEMRLTVFSSPVVEVEIGLTSSVHFKVVPVYQGSVHPPVGLSGVVLVLFDFRHTGLLFLPCPKNPIGEFPARWGSWTSAWRSRPWQQHVRRGSTTQDSFTSVLSW